MDLKTLLSVVTTTFIVAGVIVALLQLQHLHRQRARESALQMLHSFRTPEFLLAVNIVFDLPEGLSKKQIEEQLGDRIMSLLVLFGTLESLGVLVYRRDIDIRLVEDFFSGVIVLSGRKLKQYLEEMRTLGNRVTYYEWYQWLYEQVEKRERDAPATPAYVAYRDWRA